MRALKCLRCSAQMHYLKREKIQLGQTGAFLGDWSNIIAGALEVEIYCCPKCGKIEFFQPREHIMETGDGVQEELPPESSQKIVGVSRDGVPQVRCRACGKTHDFDYHHCPYCDHPNS